MSWFVPRSTGARSGFDRIDLDAPQPLPLEAPGMAIELPDDGSVWVGTREDGVLRYRNGAWERHAESTGLGGAGKLIDMAGDHLGRMWVLSQPAASNPLPERGSIAPLHVWEGDRWRPLTPSWASSAVQARALVPGRTGMLLVSNGPLYAIEEDGSAPRLIGQDIGEPAAVAVDEAGMLWIAESLWSSRRGLRIIDGGRVGHLDSRDGLVDDRIRSLAWDGRGQVWMLSERGRVAVYDRQLLFRHARWSPGHTAAEAVER